MSLQPASRKALGFRACQAVSPGSLVPSLQVSRAGAKAGQSCCSALLLWMGKCQQTIVSTRVSNCCERSPSIQNMATPLNTSKHEATYPSNERTRSRSIPSFWSRRASGHPRHGTPPTALWCFETLQSAPLETAREKGALRALPRVTEMEAEGDLMEDTFPGTRV